MIFYSTAYYNKFLQIVYRRRYYSYYFMIGGCQCITYIIQCNTHVIYVGTENNNNLCKHVLYCDTKVNIRHNILGGQPLNASPTIEQYASARNNQQVGTKQLQKNRIYLFFPTTTTTRKEFFLIFSMITIQSHRYSQMFVVLTSRLEHFRPFT